MADNNEAIVGRIYDREESKGKCVTTPSAVCRRLDMPKLDHKPGTLRPPRTAKVVMPFMDEMTDDAMAEFRKRLAEQAEDDPASRASAMTPRTA